MRCLQYVLFPLRVIIALQELGSRVQLRTRSPSSPQGLLLRAVHYLIASSRGSRHIYHLNRHMWQMLISASIKKIQVPSYYFDRRSSSSSFILSPFDRRSSLIAFFAISVAEPALYAILTSTSLFPLSKVRYASITVSTRLSF